MHVTKGTLRRDSASQRIIDAAGRVFAEKGYGAATIRDICRLAVANVASVNYYFGDKSRLYVECILEAYRQRDAVLPLHEIDPQQPPEQELRKYVRAILTRVLAGDAETWQARLLLQETLQPSQSATPMLREYFKPSFESFVALLERLRSKFPDQHQVDYMLVVYTLVSQCLFFRVGRPFMQLLTPEWEIKGFEIEQLTNHVTASILGMFARPNDSSELAHIDSPRS